MLITVYFAAAYYGAVVDAEWVTVIAKNLSLVRVHEVCKVLLSFVDDALIYFLRTT